MCRLALGAVWLWAAVAKIADPDASVRAVGAYHILPTTLVKPIGWGLPFAELALAVLLIGGVGTRYAAMASLALLAVYVAAVGSAWARGLQIDCGCFGGGGFAADVTWRNYAIEIGRDTGFALLAVWLVIWPHSRLSLERE